MHFHRMKRREFITLFGGAAAAWPLAARAQQSERMRRIGVLGGFAENDPEIKARLAGFRQGLERLGWSEGRNVRIDYRFAPAGQAQALAKELVALQPDVIIAHSTPVVAALKGESQMIPIVFVGVSDPIGSGFVESLARPGGNLTGLLLYEGGITGKWLAMLKEIEPRWYAPHSWPTQDNHHDTFLRSAKAVAPSLAIELVPSPIENAADIQRVIESFARAANGGLFLPADTAVTHRDLVIALAVRHNLPAVYTDRLFVAAGGLMCYGTDLVDSFGRRRPTSTASCAAPSLPTCRCRRRPSTKRL